MNLTLLFEQQKKTMKMYEQKHPAAKGENRSVKRILALLVEIGELANETRCFKFWSTKGPSEREVILEEYVDGLHFILELGIEHGWTPVVVDLLFEENNLNLQFIQILKRVSTFASVRTKDNYYMILEMYIGLGSMLGFAWEQIEAAYWRKNRINYERQENGY